MDFQHTYKDVLNLLQMAVALGRFKFPLTEEQHELMLALAYMCDVDPKNGEPN